jgi:hypothetical protein
MARPNRGQLVAVTISSLLGLVLAAYGAAGSFETISDLASRKRLPLAALVPVGVDGGLIGVLLLDIVLTWLGEPIGLAPPTRASPRRRHRGYQWDSGLAGRNGWSGFTSPPP